MRCSWISYCLLNYPKQPLNIHGRPMDIKETLSPLDNKLIKTISSVSNHQTSDGFFWLNREITWIRGGLPHKKDGGARRTFQGLKKRFWCLLGWLASKGPQRELLLYLLWSWAEKIWQEIICWFRFGTSKRWKKTFKPRPQNRILVPLRNSVKNFRGAPQFFFLYGSPPGTWFVT